MHEYIKYFFLFIYISASLLLMVYGVHCYLMLLLFLRKQKNCRIVINEAIKSYNHKRGNSKYPFVTIQLPVYNEAEVIERLIESAARVDYPADRFEIQVVDDSTDETSKIIDKVIERLQNNKIAISASRREGRKDFKAGGLAHAMKQAKGAFIAIFDSDFVIPENFLTRTIALIDPEPDIACVQGRWEHINCHENWLTRAQSVGINGHFAAEQGARSYNGLCMNFNGTAGVWRTSAIYAAGGWQGDTLTEDLDLSYRAQLEGFRIIYDFDLECPAEIPNNVTSLKSQQKRWAKGSIETAIKLMPRIFKSPRLSLFHKVEAFLHLTHYFVAPLMLILCSCTLPVLILAPTLEATWLVASLWTIIIISAMAPCVMYTGSGIVLRRGWFSLSHFPAMLAVGTGLCMNNALAVVEAIRGKKSAFIRTPKSGSTGESRSGRYALKSAILPAYIEVLLGLYCFYTFIFYINSGKYLFGFFIGAYSVGLLTFGLASLKQLLIRPKQVNPEGKLSLRSSE